MASWGFRSNNKENKVQEHQGKDAEIVRRKGGDLEAGEQGHSRAASRGKAAVVAGFGREFS